MRPPTTKRGLARRQLANRRGFAGRAAALALALAGAACSFGGGGLGINRTVTGYHGGVVADEPHAALVGREVLDLGGSAGDAAVATYFALSVTLPSTAGLGGGGVCVGYDPQAANRMEVIEFLPRPTAGGGMAIPANVRGMALLHSRFGHLPWGQLIGQAESLARIGTEVSRAFAGDLAQSEIAQRADPALLQLLTDRDGILLHEGEQIKQQDLAGILSRIRTIGAGDFYTGAAARQLVDAARDAGGDLTLDDLRGFVPRRLAPLSLALGNHQLLLPPPPAVGAALAADLFSMTAAAGYRAAGQAHRVQIMAAAVRRALAAEARRTAGQPGEAGRAKALMADYRPDGAGPAIAIDLPADVAPPATSFVVMDRFRSAVACTVTQGGWFGSGRLAAGTGIALAPPPSQAGVLSMTPLLVVNTHTERAFLALGSADGRYAAAAAVETLLGLFVEQRSLETMLARPRLADDGRTVLLEPEADDTAMALEQVGYQLEEVARIGRVNAVYCPPDLANDSKACEARPDPRGAGLAAGAR